MWAGKFLATCSPSVPARHPRCATWRGRPQCALVPFGRRCLRVAPKAITVPGYRSPTTKPKFRLAALPWRPLSTRNLPTVTLDNRMKDDPVPEQRCHGQHERTAIEPRVCVSKGASAVSRHLPESLPPALTTWATSSSKARTLACVAVKADSTKPTEPPANPCESLRIGCEWEWDMKVFDCDLHLAPPDPCALHRGHSFDRLTRPSCCDVRPTS